MKNKLIVASVGSICAVAGFIASKLVEFHRQADEECEIISLTELNSNQAETIEMLSSRLAATMNHMDLINTENQKLAKENKELSDNLEQLQKVNETLCNEYDNISKKLREYQEEVASRMMGKPTHLK